MLLGAHVSIAGGAQLAFARAEEHGAKSFQIFTRNARGWSSPPLEEETRRAYRAEARRSGLPSIAHGSYLVNLGTEEPKLRERSIQTMVDELTRCERLGVRYLVIHPGAHPSERAGLRLIARGLDEVQSATRGFRSRICLEVTAGQGTTLGWRFEHIASLFETAERGDRLGLCLDTCHLFAAGHDLSTSRGYDQVMETLDGLVGLHRVSCFHLNDCKKGLGSRVDRHEEIGKGTLGLTPFRRLVNDSRFAACPAVLETPHPERYANALRLLESMRRK